jgi:hypothetical protein
MHLQCTPLPNALFVAADWQQVANQCAAFADQLNENYPTTHKGYLCIPPESLRLYN